MHPEKYTFMGTIYTRMIIILLFIVEKKEKKRTHKK